jgi:DNA mismatch repair ATPase MutS
VEFAVAILKRAKEAHHESGLILFDELFHSTNPPDGTRTAKLFLENVWRLPNVYSIISTHVFELAREAPDSVTRLCVPAYETKTGELEFTYTLKKGICEVSSVDCILKEKGLLQ